MALFRRKKKNGLEEKTVVSKKRLLAISAAARVQEKIAPLPKSTAVLSPKQSLLPSKVKVRAHSEMPRELPDDYGDNQVYLLVRDPYWSYAYWEIQEDHQRHHLAKLGGSWESVVSVLRVYDITEVGKPPSVSDIVLQNMSKCWYINTQPNHS